MKPAILNNYTTLQSDLMGVRGLDHFLLFPANSGNSIFLESISRQTQATMITSGFIINETEKLEREYDVLILAMANMLSSTWEADEAFLESLEALNLPIVLASIGLGLHPSEVNVPEFLSPHARRLLDLTKKAGTIIGTRGYYALDYLKKLGYDNAIPIGCPSLFNGEITLKEIPENPRIVTHTTPYTHMRPQITNLFNFGLKYADGYVIQNEKRFLLTKYGVKLSEVMKWVNEGKASPHTRKDYERNPYIDFLPKGFTSRDFDDWMYRVGIFHTELNPWIEELKSFDISIGARFHGTAASILAGNPSFLFTIDMRTKELAEYHSIPHAPIEVLRGTTTPEDVIAEMDYSEFLRKSPRIKQDYLTFLERNGLRFYD